MHTIESTSMGLCVMVCCLKCAQCSSASIPSFLTRKQTFVKHWSWGVGVGEAMDDNTACSKRERRRNSCVRHKRSKAWKQQHGWTATHDLSEMQNVLCVGMWAWMGVDEAGKQTAV